MAATLVLGRAAMSECRVRQGEQEWVSSADNAA
jgi:hypothetical protein